MPDFKYENEHQGIIAGVDEAGRGPWAGPVVAGAVVFLNQNCNASLLACLNDSKKLSASKREKLYALLLEESKKGNVFIGIGEASAEEIDQENILQATFNAMRRAILKLPQRPDFALIDGNRAPLTFPCPTQTIVKGDAQSLSVAAASICAKVYRDRLMQKLSLKFPHYGFAKNAGYGTQEHQKALQIFGICPEHRKTYKPVAKVLSQQNKGEQNVK